MKTTKHTLTNEQEEAFLIVIEYILNLDPQPISKLGVTLVSLVNILEQHEDEKYGKQGS